MGSGRASWFAHTCARASLLTVLSLLQALSWLLDDGSVAGDVPRLRRMLHNGSLHLPPFAADEYRADVHATAYRCRAASSAGTILSRRVRLRAGEHHLAPRAATPRHPPSRHPASRPIKGEQRMALFHFCRRFLFVFDKNTCARAEYLNI